MSATFHKNPENTIVLQLCRSSPGFIPIVMSGRLYAVREANLSNYPVASNLSAEDYVLGLEVLGCRLTRDMNDDVMVHEPASFRSPAWRDRAKRIQSVMTDEWEGRRTELSDYLHDLV